MTIFVTGQNQYKRVMYVFDTMKFGVVYETLYTASRLRPKNSLLSCKLTEIIRKK